MAYSFTRIMSVHPVYKSICNPCARGYFLSAATLAVGGGLDTQVLTGVSLVGSQRVTLCNGYCPWPGRWSLLPRHPRHLLKGNITPAISKESLGRIRLIIDLLSDRADAPPAGLRAAKTGEPHTSRGSKSRKLLVDIIIVSVLCRRTPR